MNIAFLGSGPFAVPALERLRAQTRHSLSLVVTRPDRPARRGRKMLPTPVKSRCIELGIECRSPDTVNDSLFHQELRSRDIDICLVADYGELLREEFLALPRIGTFNLHASLLPKYRGAAPVAHALLHGETTTGVTLFRITKGLDSGPIVATTASTILPGETCGELEDRLATTAADLAETSLDPFAAGTFSEAEQDHDEATRAPKLTKAMGLLDWTLDATSLYHRVQAFNPWPAAHSYRLQNGERISLLGARPHEENGGEPPGSVIEVTKRSFRIACGTGSMEVLELQRPGKGPLSSAAYLCGQTLKPGERFGNPEKD